MKIAIIGAGNVGASIGRGWARKGHTVTFGVRDPDKPETKALANDLGASAVSPAAASEDADVIVLALPWRTAEDAVKPLGSLVGKTVIDCMNPLTMTPQGLDLDRGNDTSGAETVSAWLPKANVIKTLNQVGAEVMANTSGFPVPPVMFVAGDDDGAKAKAMTLVTDLGFEALDAGGLVMARLLEPFAMVWINQAFARGQGRHWAFGALRRSH